MDRDTIFTVNASGYLLLEIMKDYFSLSDSVMNSQMSHMFNELLSILEKKKINYSELKNSLIPRKDRKEIGLVFDTQKITNSNYGHIIFTNLIPLLNKESCHSILSGDYIGSPKYESILHYLFLQEIVPLSHKNFNYIHSSQFFIIYINNLSPKMFRDLIVRLHNFESFVGYFDLTNHSAMKSYLSNILAHDGIKHKKTIIMSHENDRSNSENINLRGYPFEQFGHSIISLQEYYFGIFLSYKIEREIMQSVDKDREFSLNAISPNVSPIQLVEIEDKKFEYLKTRKIGSLKKASISNFSKSKLERIILGKINSNYIYNLQYINEYKTAKFDIIIELLNCYDEIIKITLGLEYLPEQNKLRLITLY